MYGAAVEDWSRIWCRDQRVVGLNPPPVERMSGRVNVLYWGIWAWARIYAGLLLTCSQVTAIWIDFNNCDLNKHFVQFMHCWGVNWKTEKCKNKIQLYVMHCVLVEMATWLIPKSSVVKKCFFTHLRSFLDAQLRNEMSYKVQKNLHRH